MSAEFIPGFGPTSTISQEFARNGSTEGLRVSLYCEKGFKIPKKLIPLLVYSFANLAFLTGAGTPPPLTPQPTQYVPSEGPMCEGIQLPPIAALYGEWTLSSNSAGHMTCYRDSVGNWHKRSFYRPADATAPATQGQGQPPDTLGKLKKDAGEKIQEAVESAEAFAIPTDPRLGWGFCGVIIIALGLAGGSIGIFRKQ